MTTEKNVIMRLTNDDENELSDLLARLDAAHFEQKQYNLETFGVRDYDPDEATLHSEAAEAIRELTADLGRLPSMEARAGE